MIKFNDISIRNKLVLMLVFTSLLVLGVFFFVFIINDIKDYKRRKADDMISLAQVVARNNISTLQFQDDEEARNILRELHDVNPQIVYEAIYDKQGKLFAEYKNPGIENMSIPSIETKKHLFSGNQLFIADEIKENNEVLGKIVLEIELLELAAMKRSKFRLAALLLIAALGFTILIAMIIQKYISRRLVNLADTMKEVRRTGLYDKPIEEEGKDEISTLINVYNDLMKQVQENQQRKDEFISIASHELKTPLTTVKGYMELLKMSEHSQPNQQFVQKALENVNKLERLIKELLDVTNIQSGQLKLNKKEFSIDEFIDETIQAFQVISKTHEIIWEGDKTNATIFADRQRIEQVLINLLSNAIKYSPGEIKIIVYSSKTNNDLIIKVRDFGIGVPINEQSNIFERFYRTENATKSISGFGLGLYICRDIINRHSGRIWIEDETKGSAFYFSLPLHNSIAI